MDFQVRGTNGVAVRRDGSGDAWANMHRDRAGRGAYLTDIDRTVRVVVEQECVEDIAFDEYVCDPFENKDSFQRNFAVLARIDRKRNVTIAENEIRRQSLSLKKNCHDCRVFRERQGGLGGRFFYVCGEDPPFTYIEVSIFSGEKILDVVVDADTWIPVLTAAGMEDERRKLERWLLDEYRQEVRHAR
jgi:hypothetical protein